MRHGNDVFSGVMARAIGPWSGWHRRLACAVVALASVPVVAQPGPDGIDWVTITNPNNPAYSGPDDIGIATGRGSVGYDYRIARTEITTALYLEFYNAFQARIDPAPITMIWRPAVWGATIDTSYTGPGTRYRLINEAAANRPVGGIDWRSIARLSNWLHNDKGSDYADISNGAYDTSTFGYDSLGRFTDQVSHNPGAKYWIPTLDEYMKAAYWSPTNPNRDGWFVQPLGRDTPALYGPPPGWPNGDPANEANANFMIGQAGHWAIPLGSYPQAQSPWGLLDVSGGTMEWLEEEYWVSGLNYRLTHGSYAGGFGATGYDRIDSFGGLEPTSSPHFAGGRLASAIPSPFSGWPLAILGFLVVGSRRRRGPRQGVLSCAHARPPSPASHS